MKYGLPKDEKPRKKWKVKLENELQCLKMQLYDLKKELSETNQTNHKVKLENELRWFKIQISDLKKELSETNRKVQYASSLKPPVTQGTPLFYQPTLAYDYNQNMMKHIGTRINCITCMDFYKDNSSFEELRYQDYTLRGIGISSQIQRFKDSQLRSSRTERNQSFFTPKTWKTPDKKSLGENSNPGSPFIIPWYLNPKPPKAPWPFGPLGRNKETSNPPGKETVEWCSSELLKKDKPTAHQSHSSVFTLQKDIKTQNLSGNEALSTPVLLELKKMNDNMLSIDNRLSTMESNLSELSSRVSIMDSRLSAVDIYVTLQRIDKKWQGLDSRLNNLETSSTAKRTPSAVNAVTTDQLVLIAGKGDVLDEVLPKKEDVVDEELPPLINNQKLEIDVQDISMKTAVKREAESSPNKDLSDVNISDFVRSISFADDSSGSKSLLTSTSSDSFSSDSILSSKKNEERLTIEMADLKSPLVQSPCSKENCSSINKSALDQPEEIFDNNIEHKIINDEPSSNNKASSNDLPGFLEESQTRDSIVRGSNNNAVLDDPLGVTKQKIIKLDTEDSDEEFVIVDRSDFEESSINDNPVHEASSTSEFKTYDNITEYLEVNLGKKKDLVYEFGFEAKAGCVLEPEGNEDQENPTDTPSETISKSPSEEDSFQKFITNLLGNKSANAKQSSPFVFSSSKKPSDSAVKRCPRNKYVRTRNKKLFKYDGIGL